MKNSKYVESWYILENAEGIHTVLFNLTEKWMSYHRYNNTMYTFGEDLEDESQEEYESKIQKIPEFLPEDIRYMCATVQEKDQVSFIFIPTDLLRDKRIIKESKND